MPIEKLRFPNFFSAEEYREWARQRDLTNKLRVDKALGECEDRAPGVLRTWMTILADAEEDAQQRATLFTAILAVLAGSIALAMFFAVIWALWSQPIGHHVKSLMHHILH